MLTHQPKVTTELRVASGEKEGQIVTSDYHDPELTALEIEVNESLKGLDGVDAANIYLSYIEDEGPLEVNVAIIAQSVDDSLVSQIHSILEDEIENLDVFSLNIMDSQGNLLYPTE